MEQGKITCPVLVLFTMAAKSFLKATEYIYVVLYVLGVCTFCIALAFHLRSIISVTRNSVTSIFAKKYQVVKSYCLCFTEHFTCIIKVLFTLLYTQALTALSVKCSAEDRMAWKESEALKKVGYLLKHLRIFAYVFLVGL